MQLHLLDFPLGPSLPYSIFWGLPGSLELNKRKHDKTIHDYTQTQESVQEDNRRTVHLDFNYYYCIIDRIFLIISETLLNN